MIGMVLDSVTGDTMIMGNLWTTEEDLVLQQHYAEEPRQTLLDLLPDRTWKQIKTRVRRLKLKRNVKYKMPEGTNHFYFDVWSDEMAYILGFLAADGNIRKGHYVRIGLALKDEDHLTKIRNVLAPTKHITYTNDEYGHKAAHLCIGSQYMCKRLKTLGIEERKSLSLAFPNIPEQYLSHFIRGYFDGDGCISRFHPADYVKGVNRYSVIIVGTSAFLSGMASVFSLALGINTKEPKKQTNEQLYKIAYSTEDSIKICEWMYRDSTIHLERKYDIFQQLLEERTVFSDVVFDQSLVRSKERGNKIQVRSINNVNPTQEE
jgi:hypothetical protein